jgi:hypothetical protein
MKKTLEEATDKYNLDLQCDEDTNINQAHMPVTITTHGQFLNPNYNKLNWEIYMTYPYMLWDPLSQYPSLFMDNKLHCPLCHEDGVLSNNLLRSGEWYNGRLPRLNPRIIFDTNTVVLLVSAVYKCGRGHEIAACHPHVLEILNTKTEIPFFLTHKNGVTLPLVNLVEELADNGLSFEQIESTISRQYKSTYNHFAASFWRDVALSKSQGVPNEKSDLCFPSFSKQHFPNPSVFLLKDVFLKRFFQNEELYVNAMRSLKANWITCDHTFKSVCNIGYTRSEDGKWINQYNSVFCVLNEKGEVINWQFTASEGFEEVKELFIELKNGLQPDGAKVICIDNCCKWNQLLKAIFPTTEVKQDLFHAVQRFCKTLKKKDSFHRELSLDYGRIFRHPKDTGDKREMDTPDEKILIENLENFLKKWKDRTCNGDKILNNERLKEISKIREHMTKGCLSNIPPHCSTSLNERLHKDMRKLLCVNRIGAQLAYAKFTRYFFRHNQQRGDGDTIDSIKSKNLKDVCDDKVAPELLRSACFGIRAKCRGDLESLPEVSTQLNLDQLTVSSIQYASDALTDALGLEDVINFNAPGTQSDPSLNTNSCAKILHHALAIFKMMLLVKSKWSSKLINLLKMPFLCQNAKDFMHLDASNNEESFENEQTRLCDVANSFGFDIVQTNGDGNCFFTSVAFQLQQILSSDECSMEQQLNALRITSDVALDELSRILRELVVNEWIVNQNDYREFFQDIDLEREIERFRRSGEFAGALGDALPMGMANVLNMPILILTTVHNMPIVSVAPRSSNNPGVIWLSYNQQGPGHYDTLVAKAENSYQANLMESSEIEKDQNTCKCYNSLVPILFSILFFISFFYNIILQYCDLYLRWNTTRKLFC